MRTASKNWLGKTVMSILFGVLIVSFGMWGIADIFKGYGSSSLATIGSTEISTEQFRQLYTDKLQQLSRQFGRPLTSEQARAFGVDRQVLQQVVAEAALDEEVRRLGLAQSDADVARAIASDPNFAGVGGQFDPQRFAYALRQFGYTEQRYIAEQRRTSLRRQLAASFTSGLEPTKTQLDALTRFQNEERNVDYITLGAAQAGKIDPPSPEVLKVYFDENKALFRAPEYRKIALLSVTPDAIAKKIVITDDDARKIFERDKDRYAKPEKRDILQIAFPTMDEARAARDKIAGGMSFEDLAKQMKLSASDIDLGLVGKANIGDVAIADAAFALPLNDVSQPVKGALANALLKVVKIEPGSTPSYESLADTLKKQIASDRARAEFQDMRNKVEDERSGGSNIAEAGKKLGLDAITIEAVDRSGRGPDGKPVTGLPQGIDLISAAFASNVGVENDPITAGTGEIWFDVLGVTPSRERPLDEVKDQVVARWRDEQIATMLRAKTNEIVDKVNKGGSLAAEAASVGVKVEKTPPFKRAATVNGLPERAVEAAFRTAKGVAAQTEGVNNSDWIVFQVANITVPSANFAGDDMKKLKDTLQNSMSNEQIAEYVAHLESEIGVKINQSAFATATGANATQ
ncbi:MAG: SurA N-terminal domain-containing protein [Xanthobacteraceae bacterium]|nr:SurA N-terminal domain-containing protein [Xanthobacteraceae bacterium]